QTNEASQVSNLIQWTQTETQRLQDQQKTLAGFKATLEEVVKEYNAAWSKVQPKASTDLRSYMVTSQQHDPRRPFIVGSGQGSTPYIDPNAPIKAMGAVGSRILLVYDPMLTIAGQLQTALADILKKAGPELSTQLQSTIDTLTKGLQTYV